MREGRHERTAKGGDKNQLLFDWQLAGVPTQPLAKGTSEETAPSELGEAAVPKRFDFVQILSWDFRSSFPKPLEEAIETGKLQEDDAATENLKALHDEHAPGALW